MWGTRERDDLLARLAARERRIAELEHELASRTLEDDATGLPSLPIFRARIIDEVARSRRYRRPLALLLLELNGLDGYRATRGYHAADERLRMVALALRGLARSADCVFRGPGSSFAVLMPETGVAGGRAGAERLLQELEPVCPMAAGLACREERQSAEILEAAAVGALSEARAAGGGRLVLACGSEGVGADAGNRDAIEALAVALLERDRYTGEHSESVIEMAAGVARTLGTDDAEVERIRAGALLHGIGKVGIPDSVLNKAGPLNDEEWELMRQHPVIGERILRAVPGLGPVARIVRHEHESFDGSGYPDRISGAEIPLGSRIILACDAYHAMTSDRPYRTAMAEPLALLELSKNAGGQFDPQVVEALQGWLYTRRQLSTFVA